MVGGRGPFEGLGILVVPVQARLSGLQPPDGGMAAAPETRSGKFGKPELDLLIRFGEDLPLLLPMDRGLEQYWRSHDRPTGGRVPTP